ncbi:MAG: hypothetical protein V4643_11750 [Bacteroidota bacterium]
MEEKLVKWPNEDIEERGQAEDITRALLDSSLQVLEKYFITSAAHNHYCHIILPKYFTGDRLVHEVYLFLSRFSRYEQLINENLDFIMSITLRHCVQQPLSRVWDNYKQTVQQFYMASSGNSPFFINYLHDSVLAALNHYAPLLQLEDIKMQVEETDKVNGLIEFTITYVFFPTHTRHNYVFPFHI